MSKHDIKIIFLKSINEIRDEDWDTCANSKDLALKPIDIFSTHRFLLALETSNSVGKNSGWIPHYIIIKNFEEVIAVAPLYLKLHSQGEYIFDHNWANAYERAGGQYYPKLQISIPFTPATGQRLLTKPGWENIGGDAILKGCIQLAKNNNLSSIHITFCNEKDIKIGTKKDFLYRKSQQFHWKNNSYKSFESFTASLSSRKRKNIRKEREIANSFGGNIHLLQGNEIEEKHWEAFWLFYQDTGIKKWGTPYLTRDFFKQLHKNLRDDVLLILAEIDGKFVAGALNFIGRETLFGRYWGCIEDFPCLHFELCYYRAIEFAISNDLKTVEAGAQGSHKLARGYLPITTESLHWINNKHFRDAISNYLVEERSAVENGNEVLLNYAPYKSAY